MRTFEEEKVRKDEVIRQNSEQLEGTTKVLEEARGYEAKQRARMSELQDELAQTIKRIEQLQRGAGFGATRPTANYGSGTRKAFGSGTRNTGSQNRIPSKNSRTSSNGPAAYK